jgi:NAD+ synthetase
MKIAIAQINPIVADLAGNKDKILNFINQAKELNADLVVFPEMTTLGYPPMDLLENKNLINQNIAAVNEIAAQTKDIAVICGYVEKEHDRLYNAAAFIKDGIITEKYFKTLLPTYDVFDEDRYFTAGDKYPVIEYQGKKIAMTICEDIWNIDNSTLIKEKPYQRNPVNNYAKQGIDLLINLSASPFVRGKNPAKWELCSRLAKTTNMDLLYVNQVGGNDSLIFDGGSFAVNNKGYIISAAKRFEEDLIIVDFDDKQNMNLFENELEDIEKALVLGLRDYVSKCGFKEVLIGLSGGIDSALVAALAVKALGKEAVMGITMPSKFSSKGSVDDSVKLADNLNIRIEKIAIENLYDQFNSDLADLFAGYSFDVTEENLQARIRGNILMAASNKFGRLLLTTGNKSELAMGYCTLYGDMNGGLAVISDLPKTLVYALAKYINREQEIIPEDTITKPPSAELREDQTDQDSLPEYDILDGILEAYVEKKMSAGQIIKLGYDKEVVNFVLKAVDRNEYKRRQAAPGLKITSKSFGLGRRIPMAQLLKH